MNRRDSVSGQYGGTYLGAQAHSLLGGGESTVEKWDCIDKCTNSAGCRKPAKCERNGFWGTCDMVAAPFSGWCNADPNGPMSSCTTVPANDDCYVYYSNPCPVGGTCVTIYDGCGTRWKCQ
jgi:hypothetical protein